MSKGKLRDSFASDSSHGAAAKKRTRQSLRTAFVSMCAFLLVCETSIAAEKPNVLFIAIDDLRCDLGHFGVSHAQTPNLDAFCESARAFSRHYVQVPTCGASRLALLRGKYPSKPVHIGNNGIAATSSQWAKQSLPGLFQQAGYRTLALGKISHHPGGLTGKNWSVPPEELPGVWERSWVPAGPWPHPLAMMHGYAAGAARVPGKSPALEMRDVADESYPDGLVARDAVAALTELSSQTKPWFFAVGFFKPHLPFAAPKKYFDLHNKPIPSLPAEAAMKPSWPSSYHASGEFRGNYSHPAGKDPATDADYAQEIRRAYAASVSYVDAQVGKVLAALREKKLEQNTIVVIWGDHGFLLGEHAIWGKHCLYENALRSPLIIRYPGMPQPGKISDAIVETVDVIPTLADLCDVKMPTDLDGKTLRPQLKDPARASSKPARGFWNSGLKTVRTDRWRLIIDPKAKRSELFDYQTDQLETQNHAVKDPARIAELRAMMEKS